MMRHVLVVDDDGEALAVISMLLEREGYKVDLASNLDVAIRKLQVNEYDILLMDDFLVGGSRENNMRGIDFVLAVREGRYGESLRNLPFLILTSGGCQRAVQVFGPAFVIKKDHFRSKELLTAMQYVLKGKAELHSLR